MKKLLVTLFAIAIMVPVTAQAENWYVTADGGVALLNDSTSTDREGLSYKTKFNSGYLLDGGLGYDFGNVRTEAVFHYQRDNVDRINGVDGGGYVSGAAVMVNGYYDFKTGYGYDPFITAGLGWARVKANDVTTDAFRLDDDDSVFAWQAGVGVGIALTDVVYLDVTYRYFATSDPTFDSIDSEVKGNNFSLGVRYNY